MKKLYIILVMLLSPVMLFSQTKQINAILDKYESRKDVTSIQLNSTLIGSFLSSLMDDETKDLVSKINVIRILNIGGGVESSETARHIKQDISKAVESGTMENIINMKEGGKRVVDVFVSKNSNEVLLFVSGSSQELTVISMFGTIDKKVIDAVVSGKINIKK